MQLLAAWVLLGNAAVVSLQLRSTHAYLDVATLLNFGRWQEAWAGVDGAGWVVKLKGCIAADTDTTNTQKNHIRKPWPTTPVACTE